MPKSARIKLKKPCYHIITWGNQKQTVFKNPEDYQKYLLLVTEHKDKFKFRLFCFCLMTNHVHLIIEVDDPQDLNKIVSSLNLSYALYFNLKYKRSGELWQNKFKSNIIDEDAYLIECIRHIEYSPVRNSLVSAIYQYPWSSYNFQQSKILDNLYQL